MTINELKAARFRYLQRVYELSGADEHKAINISELVKDLGFDKTLADSVCQYLRSERLIRFRTLAAESLEITHQGIKEVEEALSHPDKPTHYFPPINIISIGQMVNSTIQQASPGAHQLVQAPDAPKPPANPDPLAATPEPALTKPAYRELDDNDALSVLESWLGHRNYHLNSQTIFFAEVDAELNLKPGTAERLLEQAGRRWNYVVGRRGAQTIQFKKGPRISSGPLS